MNLAKKLLEAGVLIPESNVEFPQELREELLAIVTKLDRWPTSREDKELTILTKGGTFHVFDFDGYICSTRSIEGLTILLMLSEHEKGTRKALFGDVRPKASVSELDKNFADLQARARELAARMNERRERGPGEPGYGTPDDGSSFEVEEGKVVRAVGLNDGPPKF